MKGLVKLVGWAVVVFAVLFVIGWAFLFETHTAEDNSNAPNIIRGDQYLVYIHAPLDIGTPAVCADPRDDSQKVVGRIVGLPGDRVAYHKGGLYINDSQIEQTAEGDYVLVDDSNTGAPQTVELTERIETLGMIHYRILWPRGGAARSRLRNLREKTVPDESLYLLGDNRAFGEDSRTYGPVKISSCIGRPLLVYQPAESSGDAGAGNRWLSIIR